MANIIQSAFNYFFGNSDETKPLLSKEKINYSSTNPLQNGGEIIITHDANPYRQIELPAGKKANTKSILAQLMSGLTVITNKIDSVRKETNAFFADDSNTVSKPVLKLKPEKNWERSREKVTASSRSSYYTGSGRYNFRFSFGVERPSNLSDKALERSFTRRNTM